jgi:hypothetical protein
VTVHGGERPGCLVVEMPAATVGPRAGAPRCPGLPDALLGAIGQAGAAWRDDQYKAKRLREVVGSHGLPGLALFWNRRASPLILPQPLGVPFEPMELDESHPGLAALCEYSAYVQLESGRRPHPSVARRWIVRLIIPLVTTFILFSHSINVCLAGGIRGAAAFAILAVGASVGFALLSWWMSDRWLVVPGGVVIRRSLWGRVGASLKRCTPADTILIIRPGNPGWLAQLWGKWPERRRLTDVECAVLLAAWQSRIPPPNLELLSEWN